MEADLCDGTEPIEEALYPHCDGDGSTDRDINCNGIDDDGNGFVDENSTYGNIYSFSTTSGGGSSAGTITYTEASYDDLAGTLSFSSTIRKKSGVSTDGATLALNDGPNPKGQGDLALLYLDCTGSELIVTAYAYNGQNTQTSWFDGSSEAGTQAADRMVSSLVDSSFLRSGSCTDKATRCRSTSRSTWKSSTPTIRCTWRAGTGRA